MQGTFVIFNEISHTINTTNGIFHGILQKSKNGRIVLNQFQD